MKGIVSLQRAFQLSQTEEAHVKDELILRFLPRGSDLEQVIFELVCERELLGDLDE